MSEIKIHVHGHDHGHHGGIADTVLTAFHLHSHGHGDTVVLNDKAGTRAIYLGMLILGAAAAFQAVIFFMSGSVALLGDTVHNFGDTVSSTPLLLAFWLAGRAANRRYTYGYGRAEDLAGILIVISIGFSAVYILWESVGRLINPVPVTDLGWVAVAAIVGFAGNELVAMLQVQAGKKMGSEAMVANGLHARTDGLTSLAVLIAAVGAWAGYPAIDALIGIIMGIVILFITKDAAVSIWYRLMDAVDPSIVDKAECILEEHGEVKGVRRLRLRWIGHRLQADAVIEVDPDLDAGQCNAISEHISHHLYHEIPDMADATITPVPGTDNGKPLDREAAHHMI